MVGNMMEYKNPLLREPKRSLPKKVALIGAGAIGPDICYFLKYALPSLKLILVDIDLKQLDNARSKIDSYIQKALSYKKISEKEAEDIGSGITYTTDYSTISGADIVIEAVTEDINIKKKVFALIETFVGSETVIASNTSALPAKRIFSDLRNKKRATVTHFFSPAWRNEAVEIVDWEAADAELVHYLCWLFCALGKVPLVTKDEICFMLDRIFDNWCNESGFLLGIATASQIDKVAQEFVFAGPFFVLNFSKGNPIIVKTNTIQMEEGEHYKPAEIFKSVDTWRVEGNVLVPKEIAELIRERLLGILFSQSFDVIDRAIGSIADLNLGCQVGLGFRRGPLDIMRGLGEPEVTRIMKKFSESKPGMPDQKKDFSYYQAFYRHILVDDMESVKVITIRRPYVRNALNDEVNEEILSVVKEGEANPHVTGFVITGYGPSAFCSGAEISKFPELIGDARAAAGYARDTSRLLRYLDRVTKPVVAAVNGYALGGGFELVMRCHKIVTTENAWFQLPEVTLGILPGIGGIVVPFRKWDKSAFPVFQEAIRFARRISAKEALNMELTTKIADSYADLIEVALSEVKNSVGNIQRVRDEPVDIGELETVEKPSAEGLALSREVDAIIYKTIKQAATAKTFEGALEIGYKAFGEVACTRAAKEGISAFVEKRKPNFVGL
ncbi:MAG: 3-hydroxyacyl-CoA dehydrogenase/enoyl-CoA hydratase family protein [Candidatus Bathyarchaeia archaeon]|jgi:enoyl-CoA hydratase/3-hydroxyacyl-CoA dehydrogenase